jgi:hypothetical protein
MTLELAGVHNVGEFYSQHYLETLLAGDLKATVAAWKAAESAGGPKAPSKRLSALHELYYRASSRAAGERSAAVRLAQAREVHAALLDVLGYGRQPEVESLGRDASGKERIVPVVLTVLHERKPLLWVVEAPFAQDLDNAAPLSERPLPEQLRDGIDRERDAAKLPDATWAELLDGPLLRSDGAPRWLLLLAGSDVLLIDKHKWPQGKYLRFDLGMLLARREPAVLEAVAGLLHREVLVPAGGQSLLDQLDEKSHKHAFAVSTDLKRGIQQAIEVLANEALHHRRTVSKESVFSVPGLAAQLGSECIVYLYRLLFLFYVEARSEEAGVVHMGDGAYRLGYSLESLRDLEQVPLTSVAAREGTFIHESLEKLFEVVQHGYRPKQRALGDQAAGARGGFEVQPLRSQLFDRERTPILKSVKLRNEAMQKVLALLSLSEAKRNRQRGRISYAQLGINQLGAVYEGLLSYRGFFATEDVIELSKDEEEGTQSYFVAATRKSEFDPKLIATDERGVQRVHTKGTFLFRMAGRDRQKSASYYTPEVLTECLTRYTLKERLGEAGTSGALTADEILELTVCEPAMGSGAFLNEAIEQLAAAYLTRKQAELGQTIAAEQYALEKQKVKYHLAVHNSYGVDLNPLAGELGKVSLWLHCLHPGALAPYLDLRIATGNSLIGARSEIFTLGETEDEAGYRYWHAFDRRPLALGSGPRPPDAVYHFLLPDSGMAAFDDDKVLRQLAPDSVKAVKAWRRQFCARLSAPEVERLLAISTRIDALWEQHLIKRREVLGKTRRTLSLWGQPEAGAPKLPEDAQTLEEHARALAAPEAAGVRLGRVMDYWCALWFWPLSQASSLPTREEWFAELEALTDLGGVRVGEANAARMQVVERLRERHRFFHWELRFAEVFANRGGMDVILGNPPWRKVQWQEADVLGDFDPALAVKKLSAKQWADRRAELLEHSAAREVFFDEAEEAVGTQSYLNAMQNYPLLRGVQTNLYKCFMTRAWELGSVGGMVGLFHQQGTYDDPKGGALRIALAPRARLLTQCKNQLKLFPDVHHERPFAMSVSAAHPAERVGFMLMSNLFHPLTLDDSFAHDGVGEVPGIKNEAGEWDLRGHRSRLVPISEETLSLFARLYDAPETTAREARLPVVHSREILHALRRFADAPRRLSDLEGRYFATVCFDETGRQADGTIRREPQFPRNASEWVVSGPHFYVATPFNKTPNEGCSHNQDYSALDLTQVSDDFLPRTNYVPACPPAEYLERIPEWHGRPITTYFRHVHREMVAPTGERTLVPALLPPGPSHVNTLLAIASGSSAETVGYCAMAASIVVDFFVKSTGMGHVNVTLASQLPLPSRGPLQDALITRALRLNCLTTHYASLWEELYTAGFTRDAPTSVDPRASRYDHLAPEWHRDIALRTPFARRQALCEIDALAALSLGMTLNELLLIYRVQFPVLQENERETFYDQRGKIVFTVSKGLVGVGLDRKQWTELKDAQAGDEQKAGWPAWARDAQGSYVPPFTRCDREHDMATAYREFQRRFKLIDYEED